jgi:RNA polymerase sigma-70 factor (ECF subfamily)
MGNPNQFEAFMRNYQNMVFSTAYRLLADEAESQDIAQEVFLKAYERFDELRDSPTVGGWLKTVTRNLCLSHLTRHRSRWWLFSELVGKKEDDPVGEQYEEQFAAPDMLQPALESADQRALLAEALNKLPLDQRVPLVLFHIEEMSYREIAKSLKISLAKVKVDIHRGRLALRRILNQYPECRMV